MIRLFVNNEEIILDRDFSFTFIEENQYLTNNGDFSLDMEISLLESKNARVLRYINRKNTLPEKLYEAVLKVNNVSKKGKIIVLSNDDQAATVQFIAKMSEFNYLTGNQTPIWKLDFGTEENITTDKAMDSISFNGYVKGFNHFVCPPVKVKDTIYNYFTVKDASIFQGQIQSIDYDTLWQVELQEDKPLIMQPYLCYYIDKLPELLGFNLVHSDLADNSFANSIYLLNSRKTLKYSDILPDITVEEFIELIQILFNVKFVIDNDKNVKILNFDQAMKKQTYTHINEVLDSYKRIVDEENEVFVKERIDNYYYDTPGDEYYKYQNLNDDVLDKCEIKTFSNLNEIKTSITSPNLKNKRIIYVDEETKNQYFFGDKISFLYYIPHSEGFLNLINKFNALTLGEKNKALSFYPGKMTMILLNPRVYSILPNRKNSIIDNIVFTIPIPEVQETEYIPVQEDVNLPTLIQEGVKQINRKDKFEFAFYAGKVRAYPHYYPAYHNDYPDKFPYIDSYKTMYPLSYTDFYPDFRARENEILNTNFDKWLKQDYQERCIHSFRLAYIKSVSYHSDKYIPGYIYEFQFPEQQGLNVENIFYIDNAYYVALSLERVINQANNSPIVRGKFIRLLTLPE